jgi:hypothetical protein
MKQPYSKLGARGAELKIANDHRARYTNFTVDLIKQALETIRSKDVKIWQDQVFGQSTLSKRKAVFSS